MSGTFEFNLRTELLIIFLHYLARLTQTNSTALTAAVYMLCVLLCALR